MSQRVRAIAVSCLFLLAVSTVVMGVVRKKRKPSDTRVHLVHADKLYYNMRENPLAQILVGNVQFSHEGTLMYCDSALYYEASNSFDAYGHVRMVQGDTLTLTGEVLYYDGMDQLAKVRENVVLRHRGTTLYTDSLDYDRLYSLGYFFDGGRLVDRQSQLTSDWGEYSPQTREAIFNYNVVLVNPLPPARAKSTLVTDTLHYNTGTGVAVALGPSNIDHGQNHIYTEHGVYNTRTDHSYVLDRSILQNGYKHVVGDSVTWDGKEKICRAYGNAIYTDTLNRNKFSGNYIMYNDSLGYAEAADSAMVMDYSQGDTLYAHADSFFLHTIYANTDSMYRMLFAYPRVRAFRKDIQAVCDSLVYNGRDSLAVMYKDPIVWQGNQQLLGEKIMVWHNDSTVDSAHVVNQALSVERLDSVHYNQVSSNEMYAYFRDGDINMTEANRNVYVVYYPYDDDSLMIGMNYVESSLMRMWLKERKVSRIWMPAATGTMYPLSQAPADRRFLNNFAWFDYIRPKDPQDIFNYRGKKAGTELKETVRHAAPRQTLQGVKDKLKEN